MMRKVDIEKELEIIEDNGEQISELLMNMPKEEKRVTLDKLGTDILYIILKAAERNEHYEVCQVIMEIFPERVVPHIK